MFRARHAYVPFLARNLQDLQVVGLASFLQEKKNFVHETQDYLRNFDISVTILNLMIK